KLHEVRALADSVTVLRAGQVVGSAALSDISDAEVTRMVMGRDVDVPRRQRMTPDAPVLLKVTNLSTDARDPADRLSDLSFTIQGDEIIGIAGVDGSGQRGLAAVLSGMLRPSSGSVTFAGADMGNASAARWRKAGLAYLPADRFTQGGTPGMTLIDN